MKILDAKMTAEALPMLPLIDQMETLFARKTTAPDRHHHTMPMRGETDATLLLMPAWDDTIGCVKIVNVVPGNNTRGLPAIAGSVLVFDRATGAHKAILDGSVLTARRTAAAAALGARHLARPDPSRLLIVGAGTVAAELAEAFIAVRPSITQIEIWSMRATSSERLAKTLRERGLNATSVTDLETAVRGADIISCATLATEPVVLGDWLNSGQHLDLIGAFRPDMRETDDAALRRGSIFVDTKFAAVECGELAMPIADGVITADDIRGDLHDICTGAARRETPDDITIFKSVGNAVMDLSAAIVAAEITGL